LLLGIDGVGGRAFVGREAVGRLGVELHLTCFCALRLSYLQKCSGKSDNGLPPAGYQTRRLGGVEPK
jgi:hypothetical protein